MHLGDAAAHRQAHAVARGGAGGLGQAHPIKKNPLLLGFGNARPGVADAHLHPLVGAVQQGQVHPAPVRGELQGVFQQVQQYLAHAALVGEHIGQVGGDVGDQLQVAADPEFFQLQDRLGGHLAQR